MGHFLVHFLGYSLGFLWTLSETEGQRPLWHPGLPDTDGCTGWACYAFERSIVGGTTNLADPTRRKANFLWKFLCAGASPSAMWPPVPHRSPLRKVFCRAKMPCGEQVFQICCSAGKSSDFLQTSGYLHARKRVLPKPVEDFPIRRRFKSGTPGISKGPQPFCFRRRPEKTLLKGFLWATSSRRLDTALLCAAKKRGVESPGWQVSARTKLALGATDGSKNPSFGWRPKKKGHLWQNFCPSINLI